MPDDVYLKISIVFILIVFLFGSFLCLYDLLKAKSPSQKRETIKRVTTRMIIYIALVCCAALLLTYG